ncbi:MAG: FAD-dependent oxidoreductase [Methanomicrobiaceae archaeon]|nr:FAD-dependent oxidoreductase [Methanomicrobiaceae archaeon]
MPAVKVYSTKNCPYCRMVKSFLDNQGIVYESIDVGEDRRAAKEMVDLTHQYAVPVTVVDGDVIIGFDTERLNDLLPQKEPEEIFDVIVIGAGPAGLTAGVYAARKNLKTAIISDNVGGQALESRAIANYMGFPPITGEELMKRFEEQVRTLEKIQIHLDHVTNLSQEGEVFAARTGSDRTFRAKSIVIATGKKPRLLGLANEKKFIGHGLSICATCDAPLFAGKDVAVVGGGNGAALMATELADTARSVHLIAPEELHADNIYREQLEQKANIIVHPDSTVTRLNGEQFLTGIAYYDRSTGTTADLDVEGVFVESGHEPNTSFLEGFVTRNDKHEIVVDCDGKTSRDGVFAAGDATSSRKKQIVIAVGDGAKAALLAYDYLAEGA